MAHPHLGSKRIASEAVVALALIGLAALGTLATVPVAHAATDLSVWCPSGDYSGTTCTISGSVAMATDVTVSSFETLTITGSGYIPIDIGVTLTVNSLGNVFVNNGGASGSYGIENAGTIVNDGSITVENTGVGTYGIYSYGTITGSGQFDVKNSAGYGIELIGGTFSNSGTVTVEQTGFALGIETSGTTTTHGAIINFGSMIVKSNTGLTVGISLTPAGGTTTNVGSITIENSGGSSVGIDNYNLVDNSASGTITIENSGTASVGLFNEFSSSFDNSGSVTIQNSVTDSTGVYNEATINAAAGGTVSNECSGRIYIDNTAGVGLDNYNIIDNYGVVSGTITEEQGGVFNDYSATCSTTTTTSSTSTSLGGTSVPQFPLGVALLFALLVPALLIVRKRAMSANPLH